MTPGEQLPPLVVEDIARYFGYHWKPGLIVDIVYRRHGVRISKSCLRALAEGKPCPSRCAERCWAQGAAPAVPELTVKRKKPLPQSTINDYLREKSFES